VGPFPFLDGLPSLVGEAQAKKRWTHLDVAGGGRARTSEGDGEEVGMELGQACGGTGAIGELTFSGGAASWPEC
jgi:hypothetical protein